MLLVAIVLAGALAVVAACALRRLFPARIGVFVSIVATVLATTVSQAFAGLAVIIKVKTSAKRTRRGRGQKA